MNLRFLSPALAVLALSLAAPSSARARTVTEESYRRGDQFGVRLVTDGGQPFGARFELFAPGSRTAAQDGKLPRSGWVVFVPDRAGVWYARITDAKGEGKVVPIDVTAVFNAEEVAAAPAPTPPEAPPSPDRSRWLRVGVLAVVLVGAIAGVIALRRRRALRAAEA